MIPLWTDTPLAEFAADLERSIPHLMAYRMGMVEGAIDDMFNLSAGDANVPTEARQAALLMMDALTYGKDTSAHITALVASYNAQRTVN